MSHKINIKERMTKERESAMGGVKMPTSGAPTPAPAPAMDASDPAISQTMKYRKLLKIIKPTL